MRVRKSHGEIVARGRTSRFLGIVGPDREQEQKEAECRSCSLAGVHEPASATMGILRSTQSPTQNRPTDYRFFDLNRPNMERRSPS